jgi:hydrogenase maturation protease
MKAAATRVIGIGQPAAGDDGAGIAVVRALRDGYRLPSGVEIHETTDPGRLIDLLDGIRHAILVDALVSDERPGTIRCLAPDQLSRYPRAPFSCHGMGVAEAIGLARALAADGAGIDIRIVGVTIKPPAGYSCALSSSVAAVLPLAASLILELLAGENTGTCA